MPILFYSILLTVVLSLVASAQAFSIPGVNGLPSGRFAVRASKEETAFYTPPVGFEATTPGTVLRNRTILAAYFGLVPQPVKAYQLLFRTTLQNGQPSVSVTTVLRPLGARKDRFVQFHVAEDSVNAQCAPSRLLALGDRQTNLIVGFENLLIQAYLASGLTVVVPDWEGPESAFAVSKQAGMIALDSMRAAQSFNGTGLHTDKPMIVGAGYSGGGFATCSTAGMHPVYAPELNVKGWSCGGTLANVTGTAVFSYKGSIGLLVLSTINGVAKPSAYPSAATYLQQVATDEGKTLLAESNADCGINVALRHPGTDVFNETYFRGGLSILQPQTPLGSALAQQTLGIDRSQTPTAPVQLYHALDDDVVPYANASTLDQAWCADGAAVQFESYAQGGHAGLYISSLGNVVQWVQDAFAGKVNVAGCTHLQRGNKSCTITSLPVALQPIAAALQKKVSESRLT